MEEINQTQTAKEINQIIENLRNSKTDEEFCKNLQIYTKKLYEVGQELENQKQENKRLKNHNHLLSIENSKLNMDLSVFAQKLGESAAEIVLLKSINQEKVTNEKKS